MGLFFSSLIYRGIFLRIRPAAVPAPARGRRRLWTKRLSVSVEVTETAHSRVGTQDNSCLHTRKTGPCYGEE